MNSKHFFKSFYCSLLLVFFISLLCFPPASALSFSSGSDVVPLSPNYQVKHFYININPGEYYALTDLIDFQPGSRVEFSGTYSPATATIACGIISSEKIFYPVQMANGEISCRIEITMADSYSLLIYNASSEVVNVQGFYII